jgi:hypothetical protein
MFVSMENSDKKQELEETLIQTGIRKGYFTLAEGVYDPGILKAVFLAGGPGSGKSAVASTLFDAGTAVKSMSASGLKMVNSDTAFELLLKKGGHGLDIASMPDDLYKFVTSDDPNSVRSKAKQIMQRQFDNYKEGRIGVIVDGTGDDHKKIKKQKKELEALGYDCYMVYVNTTLDVAQERNMYRARKLKPELVKAIWTDVQSNAGAFQGMFGGNMTIVDNTKDSRDPEKDGKLIMAKPVLKAAAKFIAKPIRNPLGKKWIKLKMGSDKTSKSGDRLSRRNESVDEVEDNISTEEPVDKIEDITLPMDLERYLSRTIHIIGKFALQPRKNLAVLSRLVDSLELNKNQFVRFFNKIKATKFDE